VTDVPALRTDAARNRELLLTAAEEEFAANGPAASVADIARRAGVAKGTVFRHFATKEALIAAILSRHIETLIEAAEREADASDPGAALLEFLTVAADERRRHDLDFTCPISEEDSGVAELRDQLLAAIEVLVERARQAHVIRSDLTATDVYLMMCAPIHVVDNLADPEPELWKRYLGIIFDGLRSEGANPLPRPAPSLP
jgi:AcrR family transcriptional regulator